MSEEIHHQHAAELIATAKLIATRGKGLLAADESTGTIGKRFAKISVENTRENRRKYRELLFRTRGLGEYVSGAILFEETLFEQCSDGTPMVDLLKLEGIVPGIKVDKGVVSLYGTPAETVTQGLDDLDKRCEQYFQAGARFAKWRGVLHMNPTPSPLAIEANMEALARYAATCQSKGLVPVVEPEILMSGTHSIYAAAQATEQVLVALFAKLKQHNVLLEGCLLKPNMVRSGESAKELAPMAQVAALTLRTMQRTVPCALPAILFLSGGMTELEATVALQEMNANKGINAPWALSFSYGRALQQSCLAAWKGQDANIAAAQTSLLIRARANSEATLGKHLPPHFSTTE